MPDTVPTFISFGNGDFKEIRNYSGRTFRLFSQATSHLR